MRYDSVIITGQTLRFGSSSAALLNRNKAVGCALLLALGVLLAASANAQQPQAAPPQASKQAGSSGKAAAPPAAPAIEPKAIEILKAASNRLAAAHSMSFTAVVTYESPSTLGPPLAYTTKSEVAMQRPDKLRVLTLGDGPPSDFYYNGKTMTAYAPTENLIAIAPAPPTIDATLKAAYATAAIYFPFSDVVVADPYKDIAEGLTVAFYIGQSHVVGGTTTDMLAYSNDAVFVQAWIGAEDKLPRMLRAVFRDDSLTLRHQLELSNWRLDPPIAADTFTCAKAGGAMHIKFARPDPMVPEGFKPPTRVKGSKHKKTQ
jgi:hypothetical protein